MTTQTKDVKLNRLTKDSKILMYLRKSRAEFEDDAETLRKHERQLDEFVASQGFENVEKFREVVSADSISKRPVFMEILNRVEDFEIDAVLVVHYDRLTRGSQMDNGLINKVFKDTDTLILTPNRVYDFSEEQDELMSEVEGLLSRAEYRAIKRRMMQGKVNAIKQGKAATGIIPFPYEKDKNTEEVFINEDERKIVDFIVNEYLNGKGTRPISVELNRRGIRTRRGNKWSPRTVRYILISDFLRGYVVIGKSYRDSEGKNIRQTDKSKIIRVPGNHEAIIDKETARKIDRRMEANTSIATRARHGKHIFTGLMRCAKCGYVTGCSYDKRRDEVFIKKCHHLLPDGVTKCPGYRGIKESFILDAVKRDMRRFKTELFQDDESFTPTENIGKNPLELKQMEIDELNKKIERVKALFIDGIIDRDEVKERKTEIDMALKNAEMEMDELLDEESIVDKEIKKERQDRWQNIDIDTFFEDPDRYAINRRLRLLIDHISYTREGKNIDVTIEYH